MDFYYNPALYKTKDGFIPYRLFYLYYSAHWAVMAQERLSLTQAMAHAGGMIMGGKESRSITDQLTERTKKEAFGED